MSLEFAGCRARTLGAELEFQLLDAESLDLTDRIMVLLETVRDNPRIKAEFCQDTVEVNSQICHDAAQLHQQLRATVSDLNARCLDLDLRICGGGTHPFSKRLATITPLPRYEEMGREEGLLVLSQTTFAQHVHVGMASGEEAIRVMRRMTPCLPALLALSAGSPFWRGYDTGHACYRRTILASTPIGGIPPCFANWAAFVRFFQAARRAGAINTIKDVHWDIRPHPDFGTLEVRIMDTQPDIQRSVTLAALVHMLAVYFARTTEGALDGRVPRRLPRWIEEQNGYEAARRGLDADYIVDEKGNTQPLHGLITSLIDLLADTATYLGYTDEYQRITRLADNLSYVRQRDVLASAGSMRSVTADLVSQMENDLN